MSTKLVAIVAIIIASVLWATSGVVNKLLLGVIPPLPLIFFRVFIASLFLIPFAMRTRLPSWRALFFDIIPIALFSTGNFILFIFGLKLTTANAAVIIYAAAPLIVLIISKFTIKERVIRTKALGILLGLLGIIYMIVIPTFHAGAVAFGSFSGNLILALAVSLWSFYVIGSRHLTATKHYSPLMLTTANFVVTTIVALIIIGVSNTPLPFSLLTNTNTLMLLLFLGILVTVVPYLFQQWAIKQTSATTGSLTNYIQPTLGIFFNTWLLGETLTPDFLIGAAIVFLGVIIATGADMKRAFRLATS